MRTGSILCIMAAGALIAASCHCDHDEVTTLAASIKVGGVVCSDGSIVSESQYGDSGKEAVGIVFHVNGDAVSDHLGYAVYIHDMEPLAFAESLGVDQGTSASLTEEDGNENTYSLFYNEDVSSPMAVKTFDMWRYGQSAYVPSVRQLALLFDVRQHINARISAVGGDPLSLEPEDCWLWSSTEVEGQEENKAWLYSMQSGVIQETPKTQEHNFRPVITIYNVK